MKTNLFLMLCAFPLLTWGQITFEKEDLPRINETLVLGSKIGVDPRLPGSAGTNQVWDFRGINTDFQFTFNVLDPDSVSSSIFFPEATQVLADNQGGASFLKITDDCLLSLGNFSGGFFVQDTLLLQYEPPRKELLLPLNYQDTFSTNTRSELLLNEFMPGTRFLLVTTEEVISEVDAYGTIRLDNGDFEVLRLRQVSISIDSTFLASSAGNSLIDTETTKTTSYSWIAKEAKGPIVTLDLEEQEEVQGAIASLSILDLSASQFVPDAAFQFSEQSMGQYAFVDESSNNPNNWNWNFGDGTISDEQNPTHQFTTEGNFLVCLTASNDLGSDSTCTVIQVDNLFPEASFSFQDNGQGLFSFTNSTQGENNQYFWDFGDGSTSDEQDPAHQFPGDGVYQVCLIATNSFGSDTSCTDINITGLNPVAGFSFQDLGTGQIAFTDQSSGLNNQYFWDFGDGNSTTEQNPTHQYRSEGPFTVCLITTNAFASDTLCQSINITGLNPVAGFGFQDLGTGQIAFTDQSSGLNNQYFWDFGDGNSATEQNPTHQYQSEGPFTVCLVASNAFASDTLCQSINITGLQALADFEIIREDGPRFRFNNLSQGLNNQYNWSFGDGKLSTEASPTYSYSEEGIYTVRLIASNSLGQDTSSQIITLDDLVPLAQFSVDIGEAGLSNFTDNSLNNPTSWMWDFGDGNTSSEQNPSHTYTSTGTFNVTLISSNSFGTDTSSQEINIIISKLDALYPGAQLIIGPNPFSTQVQLNLTGVAMGKDFWIEVFDVRGKSIFQNAFNTQQTLQTNTWMKGTYILRLYSEEHQQTVGTYRLVKY